MGIRIKLSKRKEETMDRIGHFYLVDDHVYLADDHFQHTCFLRNDCNLSFTCNEYVIL
jgi:hypothetical protein